MTRKQWISVYRPMETRKILHGCLLVVGIAAWAFLLGHVWAIEQLDLTTPIPRQSITSYRVIDIHMNWPNGEIDILVVDNLNATSTCSYRNAEATSLMSTLNTLDLSVKSLQKRILEKCSADGKLGAGTISGTPQ